MDECDEWGERVDRARARHLAHKPEEFSPGSLGSTWVTTTPSPVPIGATYAVDLRENTEVTEMKERIANLEQLVVELAKRCGMEAPL